MGDKFFQTIDTDNYDYKDAFKLVDELYELAKDYEATLAVYKKYQNGVKDLDSDQINEIKEDPEFSEIQEKLNWLHKFDTSTL